MPPYLTMVQARGIHLPQAPAARFQLHGALVGLAGDLAPHTVASRAGVVHVKDASVATSDSDNTRRYAFLCWCSPLLSAPLLLLQYENLTSQEHGIQVLRDIKQ